MSSTVGQVINDGQIVGWFKYYGTSDVCGSLIVDSERAVWAKDYASKECTCGQPSVPVLIYSAYGNGFYWGGKACLTCKALTDNLYIDDARDYTQGHPLGHKNPQDPR